MVHKYSFFNNEKFQKNDIILIPFDDKVPSTYRVLYSNAKLKKLRVVVLEDTFKHPITSGTIIDISKAIFEGYWGFKLVKNVKPKGEPIVENP